MPTSDEGHEHAEHTEEHAPQVRGPQAICYFQGETVERVWEQIDEYGTKTARLFLLTDDRLLNRVIQGAQKSGTKFYVQVKSADGEGGDPNDNSHPCPGSPSC